MSGKTLEDSRWPPSGAIVVGSDHHDFKMFKSLSFGHHWGTFTVITPSWLVAKPPQKSFRIVIQLAASAASLPDPRTRKGTTKQTYQKISKGLESKNRAPRKSFVHF